MNYLKSRIFFIAYILIVINFGCTTSNSFYKITAEYFGRHELSVSPDRINLECEEIDGDDEHRYGFTINVLDEEKTILPIIQGNTIAKEDCDERLDKIGSILKNGKKIYIAGIGDLNKPRNRKKDKIKFKNIGEYYLNGRVLQFHFIANEHGQCYSAYYRSEKPCPTDEFPINKENK